MKKLLLSSFLLLGCIGFASAQQKQSQKPAAHAKKVYQNKNQKAIDERQIAAKKAAANRPKSVLMEKGVISSSKKAN